MTARRKNPALDALRRAQPIVEQRARYDERGVRLTDCCGAYSTYMDDALCCKACCREVPSGQGDGNEVKGGGKVPALKSERGVILFKHEGEMENGMPVGPCYVRRNGTTSQLTDLWITLSDAKRIAKILGFEVEES